MQKLRHFSPAIRLAIGCLILAIGLRTWLVMGLIEPLTVAGSSMVPTLRGSHVTAQCPKCRHQFPVGSEFAAGTASVACPQCDKLDVPLEALVLQRGDGLWVDRASLLWRQPKRWEVVVAHNPQDASELCIKRIVGLPGEQVSLQDGNVLISNEVVTKSFDERHNLRQRIHREQQSSKRWKPEGMTSWLIEAGVWHYTAMQQEKTDWLYYQHPRAKSITDDVTYNAGLTRKLNLIHEFMISTELSVRGDGSLSLAIDDGSASAQVTLHLFDGSMTIMESKRRGPTVQLSEQSRERLAHGNVQLEFSNFDHELLLLIDGQVALRRPWPRTKAVGTDRPVSIGAWGVEVRLEELSLYRDIYHSSHPANAPPPSARWWLGPDEYFLLGDNAPISVDSRLWGPVSARLLLGKPLLGGR